MKIRDKKSLFYESFESDDNLYHKGIFVDIFAYDYLPNNKIKRQLLKWFSKKLCKTHRAKMVPKIRYTDDIQYRVFKYIFSYDFLDRFISNMIDKKNKINKDTIGFGLDSSLKRAYDIEDFFPLINLEFEGCKFLVPKNYNSYLYKTYGDYKKLPSKNKQKPGHHKLLVPNIDMILNNE